MRSQGASIQPPHRIKYIRESLLGSRLLNALDSEASQSLLCYRLVRMTMRLWQLATLLSALVAVLLAAQSPSAPVSGTKTRVLSFTFCFALVCSLLTHLCSVGPFVEVYLVAGTHDDVGWLLTPAVRWFRNDRRCLGVLSLVSRPLRLFLTLFLAFSGVL